MSQATVIDERKYLDPVFLEYGMEVYSNEYIEMLRKENLELKQKGKRSYNLIPQSGFQEKVLTSTADIVICGGGNLATVCAGFFAAQENLKVSVLTRKPEAWSLHPDLHGLVHTFRVKEH